MSKKIALLAAVCMPLLATSAHAVDVNQNMTLAATITASCILTVNSNINFGGAIISTSVINNAQADFDVNCTTAVPYLVGINNGNQVGRQMLNGVNTADYELYTDAARTTLFPNIGTSSVGGTGTGGNQNFVVYGQMPVQSTPPAATYTDTVVVTVRY